jgi:hypothetical protein
LENVWSLLKRAINENLRQRAWFGIVIVYVNALRAVLPSSGLLFTAGHLACRLFYAVKDAALKQALGVGKPAKPYSTVFSHVLMYARNFISIAIIVRDLLTPCANWLLRQWQSWVAFTFDRSSELTRSGPLPVLALIEAPT